MMCMWAQINPEFSCKLSLLRIEGLHFPYQVLAQVLLNLV